MCSHLAVEEQVLVTVDGDSFHSRTSYSGIGGTYGGVGFRLGITAIVAGSKFLDSNQCRL